MSKSKQSKDMIMPSLQRSFQVSPYTLAFIIAFGKTDLSEQDYLSIDAIISAAVDSPASPKVAMIHRILSFAQNTVILKPLPEHIMSEQDLATQEGPSQDTNLHD